MERSSRPTTRILRVWSWWGVLGLSMWRVHDAHAASGGLRPLPFDPYTPVEVTTFIGDNGNGDGSNDRSSSAASAKTPQEILLQWQSVDGTEFDMQPLAQLDGGASIVVFYDRAVAPDESAVVTFDVRTQVNCVVSICGTTSWLLFGSSETCFVLRVAPKYDQDADQMEDGLITGLSAAFSRDRPVAKQLYLKFDDTNFIDHSPCQYEVVKGHKTLRTSTTQAMSRVLRVGS